MWFMYRNAYNSLKFKENVFIWAMFKCFVFVYFSVEAEEKRQEKPEEVEEEEEGSGPN